MMTDTNYQYAYWRMIDCRWRLIKYLTYKYIPSNEFEKVLPVGQKPT